MIVIYASYVFFFFPREGEKETENDIWYVIYGKLKLVTKFDVGSNQWVNVS